MNCFYHPDREAKARCSSCNNGLCNECAVTLKNGMQICSRCMALEAAQDASRGWNQHLREKKQKATMKGSENKRRKRLRLAIQLGLIIIGIIIIVLEVPGVLSNFKEEKPLRHGSYQTDALTDQCIRNLWKVSKLLQEGKLPGKDILCPASGRPYEVVVSDTDVTVRSPNPELYGAKEIRVSKRNPVPELIK